jgi:sulfate adenylyltransferase subunit 2
MAWRISHLRVLKAESIHILREVAAAFQPPLVFSRVGKDSSVVLRLAAKAFYSVPVPSPLPHLDKTYKLFEMIEFRDQHAPLLKGMIRG